MSNDNDNDSDNIGYGKPPKHSQFKKGQSGCPDGGHTRRRERRKEKREKENEQAADIANAITRRFSKRRRVKVDGKDVDMTTLELSLLLLEEDVIKHKDPKARALWFSIAERNGWLKPPKPGSRGGVLVVYPPYSPTRWDKATEGQVLTKDPLEGIPGYDPAKLRAGGKKRGVSAD